MKAIDENEVTFSVLQKFEGYNTDILTLKYEEFPELKGLTYEETQNKLNEMFYEKKDLNFIEIIESSLVVPLYREYSSQRIEFGVDDIFSHITNPSEAQDKKIVSKIWLNKDIREEKHISKGNIIIDTEEFPSLKNLTFSQIKHVFEDDRFTTEEVIKIDNLLQNAKVNENQGEYFKYTFWGIQIGEDFINLRPHKNY
jgi:hypothetical protein